MDRLNYLLGLYPYPTQGTISLVLQVAGDCIAQIFIEKKNRHTYDYIRSAKFAVFGFLTGLIIYLWYSFLDEAIHYPDKELVTALVKLAADQIFFAPTIILTSTAIAGFMQEYKLSGMVKIVKRDFPDIFIAELKVWPIVQFINFYFIPLDYQLFFNAAFSLGWNTYFCWKTWRPDQVPEDGAAESNPADVEAPAVKSKPADVQAPAVKSKPADVQAPAVKSKPADVQAPAVKSKPADPQAPSKP